MRLHADRVDHGVRPAAVGQLTDRARQVVLAREIEHLEAATTHALQPLGHQVHADHAITAMRGDPGGHVADRPEAEHDQRATVGHAGVLDALPCRRQHVGEEHEAIVGRTLRDLDRQEVAERNAQELRLSARYLAVELGETEQRRAGAVFVHLGGLALRMQATPAHPAVPAGDVERNHHAVADGQLGHRRADLLDDAHRFVPEHVACVQVGRQHGVEM